MAHNVGFGTPWVEHMAGMTGPMPRRNQGPCIKRLGQCLAVRDLDRQRLKAHGRIAVRTASPRLADPSRTLRGKFVRGTEAPAIGRFVRQCRARHIPSLCRTSFMPEGQALSFGNAPVTRNG
ncbi:hypothetical protein CCR90_09605 [Rhodovulum sulfidophilum]|nr:hypothetical protein [Rhodovulum sulfidophilum]